MISLLFLMNFCQAMPISGLQVAESFALCQQIRAKIDSIGSHETK
jgi:hypothetical protein